MHHWHPIITLCGLTEACVLIMPCMYVCTWCQLRSVVPSPNSMVASREDDTEQRSHQLPFVLPAVTLPQSARFRSERAKCQQHSATRCTSSADLKGVASIWGKAENTHRHSALHLFCTPDAMSYFNRTARFHFIILHINSFSNLIIIPKACTEFEHVAQLYWSI